MKNSQKKFVEITVRTNMVISRNECLRNYITRLSAIVCDMQKHGYVFEATRVPIKTKWGDGYDYEYRLITAPKDPVYK